MTNKVYVDGANIAHEDSKTISVSRVEDVIDELEKLGLIPHVLLSNYIIKKIKYQEIVNKLVNEGKISPISNDDDEALITVAYKKNAFFLTNDRFKNHKKKEWWSPELSKWIESKRIPYEFIEGKFSIPIGTQYQLSRYLKKSKKTQMSLSEFKTKATNGGISADTPTAIFPEPVQHVLNFVSKISEEISLAALGSELKNMTGLKLNNLFGKSTHAARFFKTQGFQVRSDDYNIYVLTNRTK